MGRAGTKNDRATAAVAAVVVLVNMSSPMCLRGGRMTRAPPSTRRRGAPGDAFKTGQEGETGEGAKNFGERLFATAVKDAERRPEAAQWLNSGSIRALRPFCRVAMRLRRRFGASNSASSPHQHSSLSSTNRTGALKSLPTPTRFEISPVAPSHLHRAALSRAGRRCRLIYGKIGFHPIP